VTRGWPARAQVSLLFLGVACALLGAGMWAYSGGSWLTPHASRFLFWQNFWCDLLREPAHNGRPNGLSVIFATAGFVSLALSLLPFWFEVSLLLGAGSRALVRRLGVTSALATALVALLPSDRFPALHAPSVLLAGGLGFVCGSLCSARALAGWRAAPAFALCSVGLMSAAALNLVLYLRVAYFHGPDTMLLPVAQKLATLGLIAWMISGLSAARTARQG
jgi:hypothetical protein